MATDAAGHTGIKFDVRHALPLEDVIAPGAFRPARVPVSSGELGGPVIGYADIRADGTCTITLPEPASSGPGDQAVWKAPKLA